jgi:hypothetical protein
MYYTTKANFTLQNSSDTYLYINKKYKGTNKKKGMRCISHMLNGITIFVNRIYTNNT